MASNNDCAGGVRNLGLKRFDHPMLVSDKLGWRQVGREKSCPFTLPSSNETDLLTVFENNHHIAQ